ncbi:MAG: N-acetylmuramoyl-L-alanine amidase family protein [Bdellovibrionales bacterium]
MRIPKFLITLLAVFFLVPAYGAELPLVVLDPGHLPSAFGVQGSCGTREVDANDSAAQSVQRMLENSGNYQVRLTRQFQKDVLPPDLTNPASSHSGRESKESLLKRAEIANEQNASVFISIHHDSAESQYLVKDQKICNGRGGLRLSDEFKKKQKAGFNIFVYQGDEANKARFESSQLLAGLIAKRLKALGLVASDYHQEPVESCQSCRPLNAEGGVWNQDLAVLKVTKMPAILIETQNLMDPQQEEFANTPQFKENFARAVREGLDEYYGTATSHAALALPAAPAAR